MFLAKNQQVGIQIKHIDMQYHFIHNLIWQDKILDLQYVKSEENYADK